MARVLPFDSGRLPRVSRAAVALDRLIASRLRFSEFDIVDFERWFDAPLRIGFTSARVTSEIIPLAPAIELDLEGATGFLAVDADFALRCVARVLGYANRELLAPRPLGGAEEGVLLYLVASVLLHCQRPVRIVRGPHDCRMPTLVPMGSIACVLRLELGSSSGSARMFLPKEALERLPDLPRPIPPLDVTMAVERGRARILFAEANELQPGDVLLLAEEVVMTLGKRTAQGTLREPDAIMLLTVFEEKTMSDWWDETEIEIVALAGRVTLSVKALAELAPGAVIELDEPVGSLVELHVGKRLFAKAELVDIEGKLGARIVEIKATPKGTA